MIVKPLYKTTRPDGGVTVSPNKPLDGVEYTECVRLIADEGKTLTHDGVETYACVDVESVDGWRETDEEISAKEALQIITGGEDE